MGLATGCETANDDVKAEPAASARVEQTDQPKSRPAATSAAKAATSVAAEEVNPPPAMSAKQGKQEKKCSPGACAPGVCG